MVSVQLEFNMNAGLLALLMAQRNTIMTQSTIAKSHSHNLNNDKIKKEEYKPKHEEKHYKPKHTKEEIRVVSI